MRTNRYTLLLILTLALAILAAAVVYAASSARLVGALIEPPKPMPDFTLQSADGPVSLSDFRGKLVVLYFGYTYCPDVCPTTLANLRQALEELDEKLASQVQVIFISVDWQRDTPEKLTDYAHAFNPTFIGLTGSRDQIDAVTRDFGIYYLLNTPDANGYYSVDHSSSTSVLDRQGNLTALWSYGTQPFELASDLKILLRK